jgi:hypothetical protein
MSFQQESLKEINTDNLDIINITHELYDEEDSKYDNYEIKKEGGGESSDEELGSSDEELGSSNSANKELGSSDEELGSSKSSSEKNISGDQELRSLSNEKSLDEEEEDIEDILDRESEIDYLNTDNLNIGDYIRIESKDKSHKLNNKEGNIIFKTPNIITIRNPKDKLSYIIETKLYIIPENLGIKKIVLLKKNKSEKYLFWKDINAGNNIKLLDDKTGEEKEGVVIKNILEVIDIQLTDGTILILDLSQGISPEYNISDIERIDVDIEEHVPEGIEILEDENLEEILEVVPIPENERLYSNKEEFNDMFESIISQMKTHQINRLVEEEIKKSIELFFKIRNDTTIYSEKTGNIEGIKKRNEDYKPLVNEILNHNFENISLLPIINDKKKIYVGTEALNENEKMYQVNFNDEMKSINNIFSQYLNGDFNSLGNSFDTYYKEKNKITNPNKNKENGYEYFTKKDLLVARNCFDTPCEYIDEKNTVSGTSSLDFSLRKSLPGLTRPTENIIKHNDMDVSEKINISNPEKLNIIGFISFPRELYNNKNLNNVDNIKELYSKYHILSEKYKKYSSQDKVIKKHIYAEKDYESINDISQEDINKDFKLIISVEEEEGHFEGKLTKIEGDNYYFKNIDDSDSMEFITFKGDERITSVEKIQNDSGYLKKEDKNKHFRLTFRNEEDPQNDVYFEGKLIDVNEESYFFEPLDIEIIKQIGNEPQEFEKDKENIISIKEIKIENNKIQIFLFDQLESNITKNKLKKLCDEFVPSLSEIIDNYEKKNKILNSTDIEKSFFKYNITINNVHSKDFKLLKDLLEKNVLNYIESKEKENILYESSLKDYKKNLEIFKNKMKERDFDFFSNKYFSDQIMKECYSQYKFNELLSDNEIFRLSWLDSQSDFGKLFYKIIALEDEKEFSEEDKIIYKKKEYEKTIKGLYAEIENLRQNLVEEKTKFKSINDKCSTFKFKKIYYSFEKMKQDNGKEIFYDKKFDTTPFDIKEKILSENPSTVLESPEFLKLLQESIKKQNETLEDTEIDILIADLLQGGKKIKVGDLCLLNDGTNRIFERGILGDSQDEVWILSNLEANNNEDLCNQQGIKITEINPEEMLQEDSCILDKKPEKISENLQDCHKMKPKIHEENSIDDKCISREQFLIKKDIKRIETQIELLEGSLQELDNVKEYKSKLETEKNMYIQKNIRYKQINEINLNIKENIYKKLQDKYSKIKRENKSKIFKVLKKIMGERNIIKRNINLNKLLQNRKYVREALEENDENNNWLYTQDTNEKLISVHWLLKVRITLEPDNASEIIQELIDTYGIIEYGSDQIVSKIDGDPLREIDHEIFEGFEDDEGGFKNTREILVQEKEFSLKNIDTNTYKPRSLENEIHNVLSKFLIAIFIEIKNEDIQEIVGDISGILKSKYLGDEELWKKERKEKGETAKSTKNYYINASKYKTNEKYRKSINEQIEKEYLEYKNKLILFATVSRLFIQLQTSIPEYKPEGIYAGCNYNLDGYPLRDLDNPTETNGITYFTCVLQGLSIGETPWNTIRKLKKDKIRNNTIKWIDEWLTNTSKLVEKYKIKKQDIQEKDEKYVEIKTGKQYWENFKPNLSGAYNLKKIDIDITQLEENIKSASSLEREIIIKQLEVRNNWLSSQILNEINSILSTESLEYTNQFGIPLVQNSCCYNDIKQYQDYFDFFTNKNQKIKELLSEMQAIQNIYDYNNLTYMNPLHLENKYPLRIKNNTVSILPYEIKEKDIYSLFLNFSNQETTFGENRVFNKFGRCIVTGEISAAYVPNLTIEERIEILKKENKNQEYTEENYNIFMQKLYKLNIIKYNTDTFVNDFNKILDEIIQKYPFVLKYNDEDEDDFQDPLIFIKDKINSDITKEEFIYDLQEFDQFMKLEIDSIVSKITRVLVLEQKFSSFIKDILINIGNLNNIYEEELSGVHSENLLSNSEDNKDINNIHLIKNYIQKYTLVNLSKIKNKKNNLIVNIPSSWRITDEHIDIVKKNIEINNNYLNEYINSEEDSNINYQKIFGSLLDNLKGINSHVNLLSGINNIQNCDKKEIYLSSFSTKSCAMIVKYIFLRILNYILRKDSIDLFTSTIKEAEEEHSSNDKSSSSKKGESVADSKTKINFLKMLENEDEELQLEQGIQINVKEEKDKLLCEFVLDILKQIYTDQIILDVTNEDLITSIGKSKEDERTKFVTRLDKKADNIIDETTFANKEELATQLREVDRELKKYKLGPEWSVGIGYKGEYSGDEYAKLREKEDFNIKTENIAKKKFGRELNEEEMQLFRTKERKLKLIAKGDIIDNFNLAAIPGDAEDVPGIYVDPGYGGKGGIPGGLVERQGGLQYGDDRQNIEDYGLGNDGAGAKVGMRIA